MRSRCKGPWSFRFSLRTLVLTSLGAGFLILLTLLAWRQFYSGPQLLAVVQAGDAGSTRWLLSMGARTDARDEHGRSILSVAKQNGNEDMLRLLYLSGMDFVPLYEPGKDSSTWNEELIKESDRLRGLSDRDFRTESDAANRVDSNQLAEMVRRGSAWIPWLQARGDALRQQREAEQRAKPDLTLSMEEELLVLSALCLLKGEPPPVALEIAVAGPITCTFPEMPVVPVRLVNRHPDQIYVAWTEGGNYRHGRSESWSFQVIDEQGRPICIVMPEFQMGGLLRSARLASGATMQEDVYLGAYIELLPPGRYTVRAAYAFGADIGTIQEKDRSFMLLSDPVTVEILPPKDAP